MISTVAVTKLHASKPRKGFAPFTAQPDVTSAALLASLHCELWTVFTRLGSAVRVATLYDFALTWGMQFGDGYYRTK
jgi:hypothetical protein